MPVYVPQFCRAVSALLLLVLFGLAIAQPERRVWLMGEVHDNPQGHDARYTLLARELAAGWRPALVMEQFDREHQAILDAAMSECDKAAYITSKPGLEKWDWPLYEPLLQLALDYRLPVLAGNVSRTDANRIVKDGYSAALDPSIIRRYRLDQPLPGPLFNQHRSNIVQGHCNMLPPGVAEKMVPAQVARDAWMAWVLENQAAKTDVVLIAGNGHVQKDVGVIRWLPVELQKLAQSHGFVEHRAETVSDQFDVIHPVAEHAREDPCQIFRTMKQ